MPEMIALRMSLAQEQPAMMPWWKTPGPDRLAVDLDVAFSLVHAEHQVGQSVRGFEPAWRLSWALLWVTRS